MTFPLSPGVYFREIDLTQSVGAVSTSAAAASGLAMWGPLFTPTLISSEAQFAATFGNPTNLNAETWFSAVSFLSYGNSLWFSRSANTTSSANGALNAIANTSAVTNALAEVITNYETFSTQTFTDTGCQFVAKWPGSLGNSLRIAQCDSGNSYSSTVALSGTITSGPAAGNSYTGGISIDIGANVGVFVFTQAASSNVAAGNSFGAAVLADFTVGDAIQIGNSTVGFQYLNISTIGLCSTNSTSTTANITFTTPARVPTIVTGNTVARYWEFWNQVNGAPGETASVLQMTSNSALVDQMHVVVVDQNGLFQGVPGKILEVYSQLSFATDATNPDGSNAYYQYVINNNSPYIWAIQDRPGIVSNTSVNIINSTNYPPLSLQMAGGQDGDSELIAPIGTLATGWLPFLNSEFPISLVICGKSTGGTTTVGGVTYNNFQMTQWIEQNIVHQRKDCVGFFSPDKSIVVNNTGINGVAVDMYNWSTTINPSTFMVMDSGYKYMYDKYNNLYRWIPLNGDIAGTCAYTDQVDDVWDAPAGVNRGLISNSVKLAFNPTETDQDFLYPKGINSVISRQGYGTYLNGQRTFTQINSAFNRINIRRLFIFLEQSIVLATKPILFEINDIFTQNQFKNIVNPFLKSVMGGRGITDFTVICDATNNTPQVVNNEQFIGAIYVIPAYVAEEIRLDFVAVPNGVQFSQVENPSF